MFKKMQAGELSLSLTLWKFGVLYGALATFMVKLFEKLLLRQTQGADLATYFLHNFSLFKPDTLAILWTLCYVTSVLFWIFYVLNVMIGLWRASGADERSLWLRMIVRLFALSLCFWAITILF